MLQPTPVQRPPSGSRPARHDPRIRQTKRQDSPRHHSDAGKTLGLRISAMTAVLAEATPNNLACQIEREDGKPLTMRCSKTDCDIDGVRTATDELRVMRLTPLGISQR